MGRISNNQAHHPAHQSILISASSLPKKTFRFSPSTSSAFNSIKMKVTFVVAALFAAIAAAAPVADPVAEPVPELAGEIDARQARNIRVVLADDQTDTAVQSNIPANGSRVQIRSRFGSLGSGVPANRAGVVSGTGTCRIFSDANASRLVATIRNGAADVRFTRQSLQNGVIVCQ